MDIKEYQFLDPNGVDRLLSRLRRKTDALYAFKIGTETVEGAQKKADEALKEANRYTDEKLGNISPDLSELLDHNRNSNNPHNVTKNQIGLGNVPNVSTNNQTPTYEISDHLYNLNSGETLSAAFSKLAKAVKELIIHINDTNNPHKVTIEDLGLGNVENKSPEEILAELTKEDIIEILGYDPSSDLNDHINDSNNPHKVTKDQLGLTNVENKSSEDIRNEITNINIVNALGYDPSTNSTDEIAKHNTDEYSHADIRKILSELTSKLNVLADSDDETLDQMSEVVKYVKENRVLIQEIVSGSATIGIVNNLITNEIDKALSAAQGVVLKGLIDALYADVVKKASAADLSDHESDTNNPHNVTKSQVGLSYVENKSSATIRSEITKENVINALGYDPSSDLNDHINDSNNPHKVTKDQLGLTNVENKSSEDIRNEITNINIVNALGYIPAKDSDITEMTEYVDNAIANNVAAPFVFSDTAPISLKSFWIDTSNGNLLKAYNANTSTWEAISSVFA